MFTVSIAALTPPAADNANPADAPAPRATPAGTATLARASSPNEASRDAVAPAAGPTETPIPAPVERLELKSTSRPAGSDRVLCN